MEVPKIKTVHLESPSPLNPLGIKGLGEGGAIAPPAAIANALADALLPFTAQVNEILTSARSRVAGACVFCAKTQSAKTRHSELIRI